MTAIRRLLWTVLLLCLGNVVLLQQFVLPPLLFWPAAPLLLIWYLFFSTLPWFGPKKIPLRLWVMMGGRELFLIAGLGVLAEAALYVWLLKLDLPPLCLLINGIVFLLVCAIAAINGFFRLIFTSARLRLVLRLLLLLFWWVPVLDLILIVLACSKVQAEYRFELVRLERMEARAENEICKTRFPIVLVHGIFFRDWQQINYWGRIPRELTRNGAVLYYGDQQSAAPVAASAAELRERVLKVIDETGCEKVNLIAHSKGGLDARYAISRLGLAPYVASLTTVNTPHRGCIFAQELLHKLPDRLVHWIEHKYNTFFHALGDRSPDFLGGVTDLTAERCAVFNEETPDVPGVFYQSVMSTIKGPSAAPPPLCFTWLLVRHYDSKENDGLVTLDSAQWGHFLGNLTMKGRRGVSHMDVIDLMREDIPGYDVREFYVDLVKDLKEKGF